MDGMRPWIGITCSGTVDPDGTPRFSLPRAYVARVLEAGGRPVLWPALPASDAAACVASVDGVLLSGGVDVDPPLYGEGAQPDVTEVDRARDDFEIAAVAEADRAGRPLLGICRGVQVLNVALGGTLHPHRPEHRIPWDARHPVAVEPGSLLARCLGTTSLSTNSHHHQAIDRCAPRLRVVATADDGLAEGAEAVGGHPFLLGVQWHPERTDDAATRRLFAAFVRAAATAHAVRARGDDAQGAAARRPAQAPAG
jgi:putative glutamine amidotransferase